MNRLDRLSAILVHLQSKKVVTAKELAERFNVCMRTVYRDIRSLENAGIPIGSEPGTGYFIVEGYHLPPVTFTFEEAGALLLGGKFTGAFTDKHTQADFESALYKIKSVLNNKEKLFVSEIEDKIGVYEIKNSALPENNYIKDIQMALFSKTIIEIQYYSPSGRKMNVRKIEPLSLGFYGGRWHLIAYCHMRNAYRDFRLDRIEKLAATGQYFKQSHPPIEVILKKMYELKDLCEVAVRLKKDSGYRTIRSKCSLGILSEQDLGDHVEIKLLADSLPILGQWLFSYCQNVEVIYPAELKKIIKKCAE